MLNDFLEQIQTDPASIAFDQTMAVIEQNYEFTSTAFRCGEQSNAAGTNAGSCKILAFGKLHGLTVEQTLHLFGDYYRVDVLENPNGTDHGNIRNFIAQGWEGVEFESAPLSARG